MKVLVRTGLVLAVAAALAGCAEEPSPSSPANPLFPDVGFSPDVSQTAIDACRGAVDAQTDGAVEVVGTEFSQANNAVYMVVGPQRAPWRCLVSNDGRVAETMFVGSEGGS
jgi:hypothetical protein